MARQIMIGGQIHTDPGGAPDHPSFDGKSSTAADNAAFDNIWGSIKDRPAPNFTTSLPPVPGVTKAPDLPPIREQDPRREDSGLSGPELDRALADLRARGVPEEKIQEALWAPKQLRPTQRRPTTLHGMPFPRPEAFKTWPR